MNTTTATLSTTQRTKLGKALEARSEMLGQSDEEATSEINRIAVEILELPRRIPHAHPKRRDLEGVDRLKTLEERTVDFTKTRDGFRYWKRERKIGDPVGIDAELLPAIAIYLGWSLQRTIMAYFDDILRGSGGVDEVAAIVDSYADQHDPTDEEQEQLLELQRALDKLADQMEQISHLSSTVAGRKAKLNQTATRN